MMGFCIVAGGNPAMKAPMIGILASDLAVGSIVKLMENGVAVEYLVVNQGKPSGSSRYDASCDGTWLLRKDIKENRRFHSSNVNNYANSTIHTWLNVGFFNQFGSIEQAAIKQVKIPYVNGTGGSSVASGSSGLSAKIFFLSGYEIGVTTSDFSDLPVDGAKLSYFYSGTGSTATSRRKAYLSGTVSAWWLRSPYTDDTVSMRCFGTNGFVGVYSGTSSGVRPALILPSNALFDKTTLILKGVA